MSQALAFLRQFVATPTTVGSVTPSGRALSKRMVDEAELSPEHVVVELGAGTGPITAEILARHPAERVLALEPCQPLAAILRERFPALRVEERLAQDLVAIVSEWGHPGVDRILSGLPWAAWGEELQRGCLDGVLGALKPGGRLLTFTYVHSPLLPGARRFRGMLEQRFAEVRTSRIAWANVPPAFVYVAVAR